MVSFSVSVQQLFKDIKVGWKEITKIEPRSAAQLYQEISRLRQKVGYLESKRVEAERANKALKREVEELQQEKVQLQESNHTLTVRNGELKAFTRTVAHDLKTPVAVVIGMAEILKLDYQAHLQDVIKDRQGVNECLDGVIKNARRANEIIESILLLAQWEQQDVKLFPLDMTALVKEAQDRLEHMVRNYNAEIKLPDQWPLAIGYGPWVEEIWTNYLSNAIKYGGEPPQIELGATPLENGLIRFWVKDNGTGLTPEDQQKLFVPFTRLAKSTIEGAGLGLSIVKCIVNKLGGQVGIESEVGQGSTFYFTLPALQVEDETSPSS